MTNKNIILIAVLGVAILGGGAIYLYNQKTPSQNYTNNTTYNPQTQGKLVLGIKDAAASMGNISSVIITVDKIEIHNQTQGWITISTATNQYDLLALKKSGLTSLLAQTTVDAGTYDQLRLNVSKVVVVQNGVSSEAKLPSGELKIVGNLVVAPDKTSTAVFDFMTDKSLHVTGNGKFIFAPVVKIQTKSDTDASVNSNNEVTMTTGHVDSDENEGMDTDGQMKNNFTLNANTKLDLQDDVLKVDVESKDESALKINSIAAANAALSGGYLDTVISVQLISQNGKKEWLVSGLKNLIPTNVYIDATTAAAVNTRTNSTE